MCAVTTILFLFWSADDVLKPKFSDIAADIRTGRKYRILFRDTTYKIKHRIFLGKSFFDSSNLFLEFEIKKKKKITEITFHHEDFCTK